MSKKIIEDKRGVVIIDGRKIIGWVIEDLTCYDCGGPTVFYEDYDASFCPECNVWLEKGCDDPTCTYCRNRPEKPLPPVKNTRTFHNIWVALKQIKFGPAIIFLIGLIFVVYAGVDLISSWIFVRNAETTHGKVISERWVYGWPEAIADENETHMVTIEFMTIDSGQKFHFEVGTDNLRIGQQVDVLYIPANPSRAEINEGWLHSMQIIGLVIGAGFIIGGSLWFISI